MLVARDIVGKIAEKALIPLYYGLGISGAIVSMLAELVRMVEERVL